MDKKYDSETGLRITIPEGTHEAVAVDELVNDFLKGDVNSTLHDLHEPHSEEHDGHVPPPKNPYR